MKHKAALLLPYFGTLPNYFPMWLKSAGANHDFTFMLFTDADCSGYNIPGNVKVIPMTLDGVRKLIAPHLDFDFVLKTPYKLCDYKPMYGLIFQDWLKDYDFWGNIDPDVIWGDLSHFITDDIMDKYGRIYRLGHLTLYRNDDKVNRFIFQKLPFRGLPFWGLSYRNIYLTDKCIGLDEGQMTEQLFNKYAGSLTYGSQDFFGVNPDYRQFTHRIRKNISQNAAAFRWKDGKIFAVSIDGIPGNDAEYSYVHFQKRQLKFTPGLENEDSFMIIPNEFVKDHELTQEEITASMTPDPEYERAIREKYSRLGKGLIMTIKFFLGMDRIEKRAILCKYFRRLIGKKFYIWER